jgi:hypothetical protein
MFYKVAFSAKKNVLMTLTLTFLKTINSKVVDKCRKSDACDSPAIKVALSYGKSEKR